MTRKELLNALKSEPFYRAYLKQDTSKQTILQALQQCRKGFAPLYEITKSNDTTFNYIYTHQKDKSIHYHGTLKNCNIEEIKKGVYTIEFYYKADNGTDTGTAKVLYILESAI